MKSGFFINPLRAVKLLGINNLPLTSLFSSSTPKRKPSPHLPTPDPKYTLKPMTAKQFYGPVVRWQNIIQTVGGEPAIFMENPNGWYLGYRNNELIGSCASVRKSRSTSWLGYYYVQEQFRRNGYGKMMFETLLDHDKSQGVTHHTFVCLENLVPMYQSIGFKTYSHDLIFQTKTSSQITPTPKVKITPSAMSQTLYDKLMTYDRGIQLGYNREQFLVRWLSKENTYAVIATEHGKIVGYNVISNFKFPVKGEDSSQIHQRMAPLYADSPEIAEQLIMAGMQLKNKPVIFIDADGNNPKAVAVVSKIGIFGQSIVLARMSRPNAPLYYDTDRVFSPSYYGNGP